MKKKEILIPFIIITSLIILLHFSKKHEDAKYKLSINGKIFNAKTNGNLDRYYDYKFFYKKKIYKDIIFVDKLDERLIGSCFEVLINPDNPKESRLNLKKELNCSSFLDNR